VPPKDPELIVLVPVHNEAGSIRAVVESLQALADRIVVIDDGSSDDSSARLADLPVRRLRHEANRGKGAALTTGIEAALQDGPRWIATIDGDGQHRARDIERLLSAAQAAPDAVILGSRVGKSAHAPLPRRIGNEIADFFISWAARQRITDTQTGLRLYPAGALRELAASGRAQASGFGWEAEALIEIAREGWPIKAIEVDAIYGDGGASSHYQPAADSARITLLVGRRIVASGFDPIGLIRSLRRKGSMGG